MKKFMDNPEENMVNAGIVFICTVWLQGQMSDLIILKNNPDLIEDFMANPERVRAEFHQKRVMCREKQFGPVKNEFTEVFSDLLIDDEKNEVQGINWGQAEEK